MRTRGIQSGFTLIELIVVMSIIAILAAVALPRLIDAQRDARTAKAKAIYGLLRSASALAHSRCELDLANVAPSLTVVNCASNPPMVNMEGTMIRIANRYPSATADGIDSAAQINVNNDGLIISGGSGGTNTRIYDIAGGTAPFCRISYQEAINNGGVFVAPVISIDSSGC
ncbi:MAG TPA: type II secretion system protein [Rhodocyclaceae bacterium]|nr:type II secretion system protein [Rhodocyclaceae bacterium]